jgi:transposase
MDRHPEFKDHYIVMDNAPIHKYTDIKKYIEARGYRCVYLPPPYSPELNPTEQFWSVCKSKLKGNSFWKKKR